MNFGEAIKFLKELKCVHRLGWNGKNMHIYLEEDLYFKYGDGIHKGKVTYFEPVIILSTADGKLQPGWIPSQADILAEDWEIKNL